VVVSCGSTADNLDELLKVIPATGDLVNAIGSGVSGKLYVEIFVPR